VRDVTGKGMREHHGYAADAAAVDMQWQAHGREKCRA
jgi:hypothetical protein